MGGKRRKKKRAFLRGGRETAKERGPSLSNLEGERKETVSNPERGEWRLSQ